MTPILRPGYPRSARPARSRRARLSMLAAGVAAAASLGTASAEGRLVQVDVIDRDAGRPLRVYADHGQPVVAGRPGARYAVQVRNRGGGRVMVVVAVDGVNVLTGEPAATSQDGVVLGPHQGASLTGWRKTHGEGAAFEFASIAEPPAARNGGAD
ncbi:MAG: hypothetical protein ABW032_06425, partial [Burkholderiaceae bacterium]